LRLIIYTGKGGTGKTVTSCSTAIRLARLGYNTLVVSADPAHTLSDAFMVPNIGSEPKQIIDNLQALQIDPVIEMSKQYSTILSYMASIFSAKGIDETLAYEIAMLPGTTQLFSLLKIEEVERNKTFDALVLDMPASGEAMRYLYFPKLVGSIGRKLTGLAGMFSGVARIFQPLSKIPAPTKDVLQSELQLLDRLDALSDIVKNHNITTLRLVANPDIFSIENAKRAFMSACLYEINVDMAIINKIMPPAAAGSEYYAKWVQYQQQKVQDAKSNFYPLPVKEVQLYNTELRGIDMLERHAHMIFGDSDPASRFYNGKPFTFTPEGRTLHMAVTVPFTEKDDFDIERYGDRLTIKVKSATGTVVSIVPLPIAAAGLKLAKAKLNDHELNLLFERENDRENEK
jgi:arsenite-transporting ATPase